MTPKHYAKLVEENAPKSKTALNCLNAFRIGGSICAVGQIIFELLSLWITDEQTARALTPFSLIFIGILLTALGVYDKLARRAGAGTLVPVTGFANSMSAAAIEFKTEGFIAGVGAKMFIIAGPVLVYGAAASVLYGAVLWALHLCGITLF